MPGTRQPTALVVAKGKKHLSAKELAEREQKEVKAPSVRKAKVPKWLPEALKPEFRKIAKALIEIGIYCDLDGDTLGRYLVAHQQWLMATQMANKALQSRDPKGAADWSGVQDRYFKQCRNCANDLGLTITSRCRLVLPEAAQKKEENPFELFLLGGEKRA